MTTGSEKGRWRRMKRVLRVLNLSWLIAPHEAREVGIKPATLMLLQGGRCYLCDNPMEVPPSTRPMPGHTIPARTRSRDHVIPKARSGHNRRNQLLACHLCNAAKGPRLPHPCELIYLAAVNAQLDAL